MLVTGMEDLIRRTVGPSVAIEVVGATGLWAALVDPPQLENALLNLCINARDAMPDGGRITIETHNKWLDEHAARTHDMPPGQYLSLCVTDTGTGMSPDLVAKVFEPFFTTKPIGEGTGLGLSMIYGFARQSGGQVRIYSEVGEGTTVCIYLPRHYGEAAGADRAVAGHGTQARAEEGETVLVVDDEPSVRMLVTDVLADLGYRALEAADSAAGLRILQSDARIDLLVTDVGLPGGMNGRQMADAGRVTRPRPQGAVHHRLRRERRARQRLPRARHAGADQALRPRHPHRQDPRAGGGVEPQIGSATAPPIPPASSSRRSRAGSPGGARTWRGRAKAAARPGG